MDAEKAERKPKNWFVGADWEVHGATKDQTPRFLKEEIWENGYDDKYSKKQVRSMRPGDRIAIKSRYTRKQGLPFDNRGHRVRVMAIKAVGTVTRNLNDGKRVRVDWVRQDPPREWYFSTYRGTIGHVLPGSRWEADGLLAFTFEGTPQDIDRFRNAPRRREQFGDDEPRFLWTGFYEAVAEKTRQTRPRTKPRAAPKSMTTISARRSFGKSHRSIPIRQQTSSMTAVFSIGAKSSVCSNACAARRT